MRSATGKRFVVLGIAATVAVGMVGCTNTPAPAPPAQAVAQPSAFTPGETEACRQFVEFGNTLDPASAPEDTISRISQIARVADLGDLREWMQSFAESFALFADAAERGIATEVDRVTVYNQMADLHDSCVEIIEVSR